MKKTKSKAFWKTNIHPILGYRLEKKRKSNHGIKIAVLPIKYLNQFRNIDV